MTMITETRTARKPHWCGVCLGRIHEGQRYERTAATPNDDIYATGRWDHLFAHAPHGVCRTQEWHGALRLNEGVR